jgi:short-chain fatty acids transporter
LDIVNFLFLIVGLLLHGHAGRFLDAVTQGVKGAGGIIIQFPLYGVVMGIGTKACQWKLRFQPE